MSLEISKSIRYIGVDDTSIDLFESQYKVPHGVSYNSYLILDEKTCLLDTVDSRKTLEWETNLQKELGTRPLDYAIVSHLEPDHAGSLLRLLELHPETTLVGNAKTFPMLLQFFENVNLENKTKIVKENETLFLGTHTLQFIMAPMVHWPEVMVTYEQSEHVLFSADGFGKFSAINYEENWDDEARRYYFNIVGKYGTPVQNLLKKVAPLSIKTIAPLHGPILFNDLGHYINLYDTWSKYEPEEHGVFIAYASIHGNTAKAAIKLYDILNEHGVKVSIADLSRIDLSQAVANAFRYDRLVLAAASYDAGVFTPMSDFLDRLQKKSYQKRTVAILENGSWAPSAARTIKSVLENFKDLNILENVLTIKSALKESDLAPLEAFANAIENA